MVFRRFLPTVLLAATLAPAVARDFIDPAPLHEAGLAKFWELQLPLEPHQVVNAAYLVDDQLYVGTNDGYAFAIHADTGVIRWLRPVTRSGYSVRRPCHAGDRVIFVNQSNLVQYDRVNGEQMGERDLGFAAGSAGSSDGTRLFIGGLDRRLHCISVEDMYPFYSFVTNGTIDSTPAVYRGRVFTGSDDGYVYVASAANKRYVWQAPTFGPVSADIVVTAAGVFVASRDASLTLFDAGTGAIAWRARFSGPLAEAPVVVEDSVFQYCPDDGLVALNVALLNVTERERWRLRDGRTFLATDGKQAYVFTQDGAIQAVDHKTGAAGARVPAPGFSLAVPSPRGPSVVLAAADGRLFCARAKDAPLPKPEDLAAALLPKRPGAAAADAAAATQPAARSPDLAKPDFLPTARRGAPVGGKSKVTRAFADGTATTQPAAPAPAATTQPAGAP